MCKFAHAIKTIDLTELPKKHQNIDLRRVSGYLFPILIFGPYSEIFLAFYLNYSRLFIEVRLDACEITKERIFFVTRDSTESFNMSSSQKRVLQEAELIVDRSSVFGFELQIVKKALKKPKISLL